jgi:hypothetical protein
VTAVKSTVDWLVYVLGLWVAGDKAYSVRRNRKSDKRKLGLEERVVALEALKKGAKT